MSGQPKQPEQPEPPPYIVRLTATARRDLGRLPEEVHAAVVALLEGDLGRTPYRLAGPPLRPPHAGLLAARRGQYRVLFAVEEDTRTVEVRHIEHRRDAYRYRPR